LDLITLVLFIIGFVLLIGISRLVVGLTVVAFGTSAPELAVNLQSTFMEQPSLAVLGVGAIIMPLAVHKRLIKLEIPIMIGVSFLLFLLSLDGTLNHWDGLLLFSGIVFYSIFSIKTCRQPSVDAQEVIPGWHTQSLGWFIIIQWHCVLQHFFY